jgi:hypothetical protein
MGFFDSFDFGDILDIAKTAASAYSKKEAGDEAKKSAQSQAKALEENADILKKQEADARLRASMEADVADRQKRALIGSQRARMGASGVVIGSGSFADVLSDTEQQSQEDQDTILRNGMREAYGYKQQAKQFKRQAKGYRAQGEAAEKVGKWGAVGDLISGTYELGTQNRWW